MRTRSHAPGPRRLVRFPAWVCRQLSAVTLNSADAVLPGVSICLAKLDGPQTCATSDASGGFGFLFLPPGDSALVTTKPGSGP